MKSIIQTEKECFICKRKGRLDRHHCMHGTANRKLAEEDGLWVWLCPDCHTLSDTAVHRNASFDLVVKRHAQRVWESKCGNREEWLKHYGKSYL